MGNIGALAAKFGNAGLVGIIAAGLVAYLIIRNRPSDAGSGTMPAGQPPQGGAAPSSHSGMPRP